jgi:hypothetical protein
MHRDPAQRENHGNKSAKSAFADSMMKSPEGDFAPL